MNRRLLFIALLTGVILPECRVVRDLQKPVVPVNVGMQGMMNKCTALDTIQSIMISKAEAILMFEDERYEVNITVYSKKDSIIYLSAVNSGYEIIRASVDRDSIKVINRLNKVVYLAPLERKFGFQYPVDFNDLQNILSSYYLCDDLDLATDDLDQRLQFEFDEEYIKKRISVDRGLHLMNTFEFYHQKTDKYLMGEKTVNGFKIYSNFMISEFEIIANGGEVSYNKEVRIKMSVNPRRYTFTNVR